MTDVQLQEKKVLRKARTKNNLLMLLVLLPIMLFMYRYYNDFAALISGIDKAQVADLGVQVIQPLFVAMIYVTGGAVFSLTLASFIEPQLKENAFSSWSRFATLFVLLFSGFCFIAAGLL